eukprot:SAG11_NODE_883_length_6737_cov_10.576981_2_plen_56_part_00
MYYLVLGTTEYVPAGVSLSHTDLTTWVFDYRRKWPGAHDQAWGAGRQNPGTLRGG